jgi:hypothetical protein
VAAAADARIEAVLIGGSYVMGGFDAFSDLDFILVIAAGAHGEMLANCEAFAETLGPLVNAFTGEHVGEPRLLVCLYGPPLLHVDMKFITTGDLDTLVERPAILFARDPASITSRLDAAQIGWPNRSPAWFEARIWIWLHYATIKLARGEWFECLGMLGFVREQILGPMLHRRAGRDQRGLRRIEQHGIDRGGRLPATLAEPTPESLHAAILASIALYLDLRADLPPDRSSPAMPDALYTDLAVARSGLKQAPASSAPDSGPEHRSRY